MLDGVVVGVGTHGYPWPTRLTGASFAPFTSLLWIEDVGWKRFDLRTVCYFAHTGVFLTMELTQQRSDFTIVFLVQEVSRITVLHHRDQLGFRLLHLFEHLRECLGERFCLSVLTALLDGLTQSLAAEVVVIDAVVDDRTQCGRVLDGDRQNQLAVRGEPSIRDQIQQYTQIESGVRATWSWIQVHVVQRLHDSFTHIVDAGHGCGQALIELDSVREWNAEAVGCLTRAQCCFVVVVRVYYRTVNEQALIESQGDQLDFDLIHEVQSKVSAQGLTDPRSEHITSKTHGVAKTCCIA